MLSWAARKSQESKGLSFFFVLMRRLKDTDFISLLSLKKMVQERIFFTPASCSRASPGQTWPRPSLAPGGPVKGQERFQALFVLRQISIPLNHESGSPSLMPRLVCVCVWAHPRWGGGHFNELGVQLHSWCIGAADDPPVEFHHRLSHSHLTFALILNSCLCYDKYYQAAGLRPVKTRRPADFFFFFFLRQQKTARPADASPPR